jgi:hypothetical protein
MVVVGRQRWCEVEVTTLLLVYCGHVVVVAAAPVVRPLTGQVVFMVSVVVVMKGRPVT